MQEMFMPVFALLMTDFSWWFRP